MLHEKKKKKIRMGKIKIKMFDTMGRTLGEVRHVPDVKKEINFIRSPRFKWL